MLLTTSNVQTTQTLIARCMAADGNQPMIQGYVLNRSDSLRCVRVDILLIFRLMRFGIATLRFIDKCFATLK
jgi:hypothetical protein